jgi:hypothetical protein
MLLCLTLMLALANDFVVHCVRTYVYMYYRQRCCHGAAVLSRGKFTVITNIDNICISAHYNVILYMRVEHSIVSISSATAAAVVASLPLLPYTSFFSCCYYHHFGTTSTAPRQLLVWTLITLLQLLIFTFFTLYIICVTVTATFRLVAQW